MGDMIRVGRISAIDYGAGTASVVYTDRGNEVSPQFPFFSAWYEMPKVNDMAVVVMLQNSSTKGFIIGVPYSDKKVPSRSGRGIFFKEFSDGASILYDPSTKLLSVDAQKITFKSVTASNVTIQGTLTAEKVTAGEAHIEELAAGKVVVSGSTELKNLTVTGTAEINNLTVTGAAIGHFSEG